VDGTPAAGKEDEEYEEYEENEEHRGD